MRAYKTRSRPRPRQSRRSQTSLHHTQVQPLHNASFASLVPQTTTCHSNLPPSTILIDHQSDMADFSPRSYLRNVNGPRAVDTGDGRERSRYPRCGRQDDEKSLSKSRRSIEKKSRSKHESTSRQTIKSHPSSLSIDRPTFRLDFIQQPPKGVTLGIEVATSLLVSLVFPNKEAAKKSIKVDTNRLIGLTSLVAETSAGELVPMETDAMIAQQLVDSIRPIPQEYAERVAQAQPCRVPLGYFSFADLLIRQTGYYRIRMSLVQVPGAGHSPITITTHDSELMRVERRSATAHYRRQQRS